jgi:hypothetical protein
MFKSYFKRPLGLFLLVVMVLMGFEAGTKKPLCISSNIVNKIDRVSVVVNALSDSRSTEANGDSTESIYACTSYKIPEFSVYFYENLDLLNEKLNRIEKAAALSGIAGKLNVVIAENATGVLSLNDRVLTVSSDRLEDADFAKYFMAGLLAQSKKTESEAFSTFLAGWLTNDPQEESVMEEIWTNSFASLGPFEKFEFQESIYQKLRSTKYFDGKSVTENMLALLDSERSSVQKFKSVFTERLKNFGLADGGLAKFDFIFENQSDEAPDLATLQKVAKEHKDKRILFQDKSGLYVLPYKIRLSDSTAVITSLRVVMADAHSKIPLKKYFGNTEKLIVFRVKSESTAKGTAKSNANIKEPQLKFGSLFSSDELAKNEIALLHDNKNFDVIQFHVPSLKSREAQLGQIKDYFGLLKNSKAEAKKSRLGWESEEWSIDAQAFKPVAIYDVIQYYRIN